MKKQICFAGFAAGELSALQAAATTLNNLWECSFVSDADAVLARLANQPLDAVVANMALAGRSGAELLQEVRKLHPKTLGFIVGDVTDRALIINCIGGTHQFISQPFQPSELIVNVQRGLALDAWLSSDALRQLAPRLQRLPSLPATYFNLLKEVESTTTTSQNIGEVITHDPVVTARLLQMVNSAAFALAQKITDPVDAVSQLGIETIKSLVLCLQVFSQSDEAREAGISLEKLWEHSSLVAKYARQITLKQTGDARLASDAFTAGLLHDVGRIVIASNLPKEYAAVVASAREKARPLHEEETKQLGVNHAQVGAYLLGLWGMPAALVEAAAAHHAPGQTVFACEFSLLSAVHAANVFAHATDNQTDGLLAPELDLAYYKMIRLDDHLDSWRQSCTGEKTPEKTSGPVKPQAAVTPEKSTPAAKKAAPVKPSVFWLKPAALVALAIVGILLWAYFSRSPEPAATTCSAVSTPVSNSVPSLTETKNLPVAPPAVETNAIPPVPTPVASNQAEPVVAKPVAVKPPARGFDTIKVQGIFYRSTNPTAIINNQTVSVGTRFNGFEVMAINQTSVTLAFEGQQKVFKVK